MRPGDPLRDAANRLLAKVFRAVHQGINVAEAVKVGADAMAEDLERQLRDVGQDQQNRENRERKGR